MNRKFELIEHTADVGVRVYGKNIEELFQNCACALFSLLTDAKSSKNSKKEVILEGQILEDLLVSWLNELISLFFACKFLPADYSVIIEEKNGLKVLKAKVKGSEFDPYSNKINMEIKAATYHNLKIKKQGKSWQVDIIFDV